MWGNGGTVSSFVYGMWPGYVTQTSDYNSHETVKCGYYERVDERFGSVFIGYGSVL